jgi:hypothetical protein
MPAAAIRRFASPGLLAGFVRPGVLVGLEKAVGGVGLFGSNIGDGTWLAGRVGESPPASAPRVARRAARPGSAAVGAAALGLVDDFEPAARGATLARLARVSGLRSKAPVADVDVDPHDPIVGGLAPGSFGGIGGVRPGAVL